MASLARRRRRRPAVSWRGSRVKGHRQGERLEKQGPVKETARISENQKPVDEVSVEISAIARRRETKSVSFAVFGALGENEEERVKENDEGQ